ncbi:hypothetical protein HC175_08175 [Salinimicrobium sp. CDJ15-91]|uniref:DUF5017 domain-containing protein n=2 Tax=Salinimicrobium oceani TaxID=2722702 RepID=A0ABX1CX92_9FLAO|nr:hypothetical protein [Salinimicrobium oceani]
MKMKNSIYLLMMFLGLALTSCEPMEDLHDDLDRDLDSRAIEGITDYTLTADDYTEDVEDGGLGLNFPNFSSLDEASELIPQLLSNKFPVWGEGSLARVTFDLYAPIDAEAYTVVDADYEAMGLDVNYFTSSSQITSFLQAEFPQAKTNDYVELTYRTIAVEMAYDISNDDFDLIGEALDETYPDPASSAAQYSNFDRREGRDAYWSNDMILDAINVVLSDNFPDVEGQTYEVSYRIYDGSPGTETMDVKFNGTEYVMIGGTAYELDNDDYDFVGAELGDDYPGPAGNAAQYNSFDVRSTSGNFWSEAMLLEAINVVLKEQFPSATEGAQFDVTYDAYSGSVNAVIKSVILTDGEYVIDETASVSTIMETSVFAFGDGRWMMPMELPSNIYSQEFGQRFNNFSSESDAGFYIGRYLEPLFPYAQQGDFVSVGYKYYNGSATVDRYASFIYNEEEREWDFIPSVIEQTLQFGHEGTGWVVDNTIVYQLAPGDYDFIGEQLSDTYEDPSWSVGNYNNFDRRPGNANQWTDAMLLEAFNILLSERVAPNAEEGQKYLLSFAIYNGTNTIEQMHLIKEDGVWVPVQ